MIKITKTKGKRILRASTAFVIFVIMLMLIVSVPAVYAYDDPVTLPIRQICSSPVLADDTFTYRFRPLNPDSPMPPGSTSAGYTFTITGNGKVSVGPLTFDRQNVCRYEVYQVTETKKQGYIYDRRVYTIEIYVDEALNITKIVKNENGVKEGDIIFENTYSAAPTDPKLMADPAVMKTVSGNPGYDSTFAFRLTAKNASQPMPSGGVNGVKTIYITGSGRGEFGTWSYDKPGIYYYSVTEVNTGSGGYSYDTAVYTVTDTVKDEKGQLVLSRVVTNEANKAVTSMIFNNRYSGGGGGGGTPPTSPTQPGTTAPPKQPGTTTPPKQPGTGKPTDPPGTTGPATPAEPSGTTPPTEPAAPGTGEDFGPFDPANPPDAGGPANPPDANGPATPTEPAGTAPPAAPSGTDEDFEWFDPADVPGAGRRPDIPQQWPPGKSKPTEPAGVAGPPVAEVSFTPNGSFKPDISFKPGLDSPKTGDETDNTLYIILLISGGILVTGSAVYLIQTAKRRKTV